MHAVYQEMQQESLQRRIHASSTKKLAPVSF